MDSAAERGSRPLEILESAAGRLLDNVPADVWCAVLLDPSTMLDTGGLHSCGFPTDTMQRLFEIEHIEQDDVDNLRALGRRGVTSSLLSKSTHGDLSSSKYYRGVLQPNGLTDELRVLLREGSRVWALLVLCRAEGTPQFTASDIGRANAVSHDYTDPLRRSLLLAGSDQAGFPDAPCLVVLGPDLDIVWASDGAERWLARIDERRRVGSQGSPYSLRALAARSRGLPEGSAARARVADGNGGWLTLRAWTSGQGESARTTVSVGPADMGDLLTMVFDVYGLTSRERDVAQQIILGRSTEEAAHRLQVSSYTVQDHLKAVFRKTGVNSRGQLSAKLFFERYLPHIGDLPLSRDGRLIQE